jgi:hypothetical protein
MEYVVKGETPEGEITIVKRGFASQEEAEEPPNPNVALEAGMGRTNPAV